jgi:hypothetical protein
MLHTIRWHGVWLLSIAAVLANVHAGAAQEIKKETENKGIILKVKPGSKGTVIEIDDPEIRAAIGVLLKEKGKAATPKHDGAALNHSLRDVINVGVKMFNEQGDYAGCYRLYQGSLISVRPFVSPDLQKKIDKGLANAETMRSYADRAFELRRVLDEIRAAFPAGASSDTKGQKGQVSGKVNFEGNPVKGGYFVTLVNADGKKFSCAIQKDGSFQFKMPIAPGKYRVAVEPIPGEPVKGAALPARFASEDKSGIVIMVEGGKSVVDLNLVK